VRGWRDLAYGKRRLVDEALRETDPAKAAGLEAIEDAARRAWWQFVASALASALVAAAALLFADEAIHDVVVGVGIAVATLTGTTWWAARDAHEADTQRVLQLASIFLLNPADLRGLIRTGRLHGILQNLLRTVLPNDDLGDSLWTQGVGPLVQLVREGRYRTDQVYEVHLRERTEPLTTTLPDGEELTLKPGEWRELSAELSYRRSFRSLAGYVWLGLVFDPTGGPDWFKARNFVLREYMPIEKSMIEAICAASPGPRVFEDEESGTRIDPESERAAERTRPERIRFARELSQPRVTIAGTELELDDVAIDERGMAMKFTLARQLRRELRTDPWAEVTAALSFPLPEQVSLFPVYFPDLTREGRIVFSHAEADVADVTTDLFFSVYRPYWSDRVVAEKEYRVVETDRGEWIFPGAGMVFSWRNGPGACPDSAASMFPRG
jgi:hypothetical protein